MPEPTTLSVRGEATLEVTADYGAVSIQVNGRDPDRELAMRSVAEATDAVRAAVAGEPGVRRATLSRLRVSELYEWDAAKNENALRGWDATVSGSLEVDAGLLSRVATAAVQAGAQVSWVDWRVDRDNPGHREVRRMAVRDAARAAGDFAAALGGSVGSLLQLADPGLLHSDDAPARQKMPAARSMHGMALGGGETTDVELDPQPILLECTVEARYLLSVT